MQIDFGTIQYCTGAEGEPGECGDYSKSGIMCSSLNRADVAYLLVPSADVIVKECLFIVHNSFCLE